METKRLTIRPWTKDDVAHYLTLSKDIGYNCFTTPGQFLVQNDEEAKLKIQERIELFERQRMGKFPIFLKSGGEFMGTCGLGPYKFDGREEAELGYRLCLRYWGQGYATEAAAAMRDYGLRDLGLKKITAFALAQNVASIRIIEKIGFRYVGLFEHIGIPHRLYEIT